MGQIFANLISKKSAFLGLIFTNYPKIWKFAGLDWEALL